MMGFEEAEFLDLLYDAAVESSLWPRVLETFADMVGGTSAVLSQLNVADGHGSSAIARADPAGERAYHEYYADLNVLNNVTDPREFMSGWAPRILTDEDWMAKDELVKTEYYNDFLAPNDIHSVLMMRLGVRDFDACVLNVNRSVRQEQFAGADLELAHRLHPHLIRAFRLGQKLAPIRALGEDMARVLDSSPHGVFLLDSCGGVRHVNQAGQTLIAARRELRVICGRLTAAAPAQASILDALIGAAGSPEPEHRRGGSMALASRDRFLPLSVTVAPLRGGQPWPLRDPPAVLVCVTDLEAGACLPEQRLRDLFALTPAEARVAAALFEGATPREAAEGLRISFHTVHVHLARIFEKTGTNRQSQLVRLMMRAVGVDLG